MMLFVSYFLVVEIFYYKEVGYEPTPYDPLLTGISAVYDCIKMKSVS